MNDETDSTPKSANGGLTQSRKGKALLIALANLNLIFILSVFKTTDIALSSQMITAVLFLAGLYVGVQGGIDMTAAWKGEISSSKKTEEITTKK